MKKIIYLIIVLLIPTGVFAQDLLPVSAKMKKTNTEPVQMAEVSDSSDAKRSSNRIALIKKIAENLMFTDLDKAASLIPDNIYNAESIKTILRREAKSNPKLVQQQNFCDSDYVGGSINFQQTAELTLDDLLFQIHNRFGVNFLVGRDIAGLPINIKAGDIAWTMLLRSQLFLSGVRATCLGNNTIQLVKNTELPQLQDTAEVNTKFIKLKFLQPSSGGNVDIAGRSSGQNSNQGCQAGGQGGGQNGGVGVGGNSSGGNCGNFEKLIFEIEKILGIKSANGASSGGGGGNASQTEVLRTNRSVSQIPGRNILVIRATEEELDLINQIIERADRPPFQVVIKGLVYTANENLLRDIGVQTSLIDARTPDTGNPGQSLFYSPLSGIFDFSTLIGTVDFNIQASALQQNGVISVKSRPFATVLDGDSTALEVGRQIPILTQGSVVGGEAGNIVFLNAGNILNVTPHVIDDEEGRPVAVNLDLQLTSNEVDTAIISQGIPTINNRSIQSKLILNQETTVILGGFTVDSSSKTTSKTPGLGDIPIIGYLFKKKVRSDQINRLYFAISVTVVPYGSVIEPVVVPGSETDIPSITPEMLKRSKIAEPKSVVKSKKTGN